MAGVSPLLLDNTLVTLTTTPNVTTAADVANIQLGPATAKLSLILSASNNSTDGVFAIDRNGALQTSVAQTRLGLPSNGNFHRRGPTPNVSRIAIVPLSTGDIHIAVGNADRPPDDGITAEHGKIIVSVHGSNRTTRTPAPMPRRLIAMPSPGPPDTTPRMTRTTPTRRTTPPALPTASVLIPGPRMAVSNIPMPQPRIRRTPPFLPETITPPVNSVSVTRDVPAFDSVSLNDGRHVPQLLLQSTPTHRMLNLLTQTTGLGLIFAPTTTANARTTTRNDTRNTAVDLSVRGRSIRSIFGRILQIAKLRTGQMNHDVCMKPTLPIDTRGIIAQAVHLGRISSTMTAGFLITLKTRDTMDHRHLIAGIGTIRITRKTTPVARARASAIREVRIGQISCRSDRKVLQNLRIITSRHAGSIALIKQTSLIKVTARRLAHVSLHEQRITIGIQIVSVGLGTLSTFNADFSFRAKGFNFSDSNNLNVVAVNKRTPSAPLPPAIPSNAPVLPQPVDPKKSADPPNDFLFRLLTAIRGNGNGVVASPALVVRRKRATAIRLARSMIASMEAAAAVPSAKPPVAAMRPRARLTNLVLRVGMSQVSSGNFISLSITPDVSSPAKIFGFNANGDVILLSHHRLDSNRVQIESSRALLLSNVVRRSRQSAMAGMPVLNSVPVLNTLFHDAIASGRHRRLVILLAPRVLSSSSRGIFNCDCAPDRRIRGVLSQRSH